MSSGRIAPHLIARRLLKHSKDYALQATKKKPTADMPDDAGKSKRQGDSSSKNNKQDENDSGDQRDQDKKSSTTDDQPDDRQDSASADSQEDSQSDDGSQGDSDIDPESQPGVKDLPPHAGSEAKDGMPSEDHPGDLLLTPLCHSLELHMSAPVSSLVCTKDMRQSTNSCLEA